MPPVNDFQGSVAQTDVQFVTTELLTSVAGQNYGKVMIFVGNGDKASYFITPPADDTITEVKDTDYDTVTLGLLKTWLDGFFAEGTVMSVFLVVYNDSDPPTFADMAVQFKLYTERAYFKLAIHSSQNMPAQIALAKLCDDDALLSQMVYGSHDTTMLTGASDNEAEQLLTAGVDAMVFYHPLATANPALVQLGATLAAVNGAGIYVGNQLDFLQILGFSASGTAGANLSAIEASELKTLNVAYFKTLGNGVGAVVASGGFTLEGKVVGAEWVKNYVDFTAAVDTAAYMTQAGKFRNNNTYQGILTILQGKLNTFSTLGRFEGAVITAPPFDKLPPSAGDAIVVPNAWQAQYVDNLRSVVVYGTLTIAV